MTNIHTLYFDYQASTPVNDGVLQKMLPYFRERAGNPHSSDHTLGWQTSQAVKDAAVSIGGMIGADADEIIFTSGATEANNLALLGLGKYETTNSRRRILVSVIEHKCVLAVTRILTEKYGYCVDYLPVDREGRVSQAELEDKIDSDVLFVSIMAVNNEIGTIQNIKEISHAARRVGAIFHCDAAQAPVAINLQGIAQYVDLLSLSAHKMYGPQGIGALYARRDIQRRIEPLIYGGGQQNGIRSGTLPVALCVGMGAASELIGRMSREEERTLLRSRRDRFVDMLCQLPWNVTLNGATGQERHPGNANMLFHGFSAHDILSMLQPRLAASTGSACTSGIPEPSHVLRAIGLTSEEADASIRFSLGSETPDEEIDEAVGLIHEALDKLSKSSLVQSA